MPSVHHTRHDRHKVYKPRSFGLLARAGSYDLIKYLPSFVVSQLFENQLRFQQTALASFQVQRFVGSWLRVPLSECPKPDPFLSCKSVVTQGFRQNDETKVGCTFPLPLRLTVPFDRPSPAQSLLSLKSPSSDGHGRAHRRFALGYYRRLLQALLAIPPRRR